MLLVSRLLLLFEAKSSSAVCVQSHVTAEVLYLFRCYILVKATQNVFTVLCLSFLLVTVMSDIILSKKSINLKTGW